MTQRLAFVLPFLLFIAFPSRMWNFDGVACAAALELGRTVFLFHSNHLLYGFLGFLFWKPLSWVLPRALPALQLFTTLLSAAALVGIYQVLQTILTRKSLALLLTLGVSLTAVVWVWSIEAQVYALGFLALAWATYALLQPESAHKWQWVGGLHAAAVLGHIVHVLWIIPALYWLNRENPTARRKNLKRYLTTLSAGVVVPYGLVIGLWVLPRHLHDHWPMTWLMGSAALNPNSVFEWHTAGLTGPLQWASTSLKIFWGSFWPYQTAVPIWAWALTALSATAGVGLLAASWKKKTDPRWIFCLLWLAVYGVFFWTWEPRTECYRMTDMIPLAILLALGTKALNNPTLQWALVGLWGITLLPLNLVTRIQPMHDLQRNTPYQETMRLTEITTPDSIYLTRGGLPRMYLLYFAGRAAWDLHSFFRDPERLDREIARHKAAHPILIRADVATSDMNLSWMKHYKFRRIDPALPWVQLI